MYVCACQVVNKDFILAVSDSARAIFNTKKFLRGKSGLALCGLQTVRKGSAVGNLRLQGKEQSIYGC